MNRKMKRGYDLFCVLDRFFISEMHTWGIPALRGALGIVFLWFGALKVLGVSPVEELVETTYFFFPQPSFFVFLGVWEVLIGIGLILNKALRLTLTLLWLQMAGTFLALFLSPSMFFTNGNIFLLTTEGEFVVKNFVLAAAGIVIGGYTVKPKKGAGSREQ